MYNELSCLVSLIEGIWLMMNAIGQYVDVWWVGTSGHHPGSVQSMLREPRKQWEGVTNCMIDISVDRRETSRSYQHISHDASIC